jgi:hypothetical protein
VDDCGPSITTTSEHRASLTPIVSPAGVIALHNHRGHTHISLSELFESRVSCFGCAFYCYRPRRQWAESLQGFLLPDRPSAGFSLAPPLPRTQSQPFLYRVNPSALLPCISWYTFSTLPWQLPVWRIHSLAELSHSSLSITHGIVDLRRLILFQKRKMPLLPW